MSASGSPRRARDTHARDLLISALRREPCAARKSINGHTFLSGMIFISRKGVRWCDAPTDDGPRTTLCNRWTCRSDMGTVA
ncbi:MAG: hypothetical protein EA386_02845 [Rhodobacteraceae bacterium]|nr:MAG: hypothetical protein EA386_02845 [Paracoccaceae bacterium]